MTEVDRSDLRIGRRRARCAHILAEKRAEMPGFKVEFVETPDFGRRVRAIIYVVGVGANSRERTNPVTGR